jgi:hypothetical protein
MDGLQTSMALNGSNTSIYTLNQGPKVKNKIHHITKVEFLPAFKQAFDQAFTLSNIQGAFRGPGIFPYDPKAVLSRVGPALRTPSPELPTQST